jgi:hypothetical protein
MARIRTIKPEFFTSEDIVALSPYARLLYIALWCEADRDGRMNWKPKTFKMRYFPADSVDVPELCNELLSSGLVKLYGEGLAYIPSFAKHQHINPRETASSLPDPHASSTRQHASVTHREEGKERKESNHASRDGFEVFWKTYPRKVGKGEAEKQWSKAKGIDLQAVLKAIERARATEQWQKDGGQFIPHPATWLSQRRWEDEPTGTTSPAGIFSGVL